jgi:hypothetical protein
MAAYQCKPPVDCYEEDWIEGSTDNWLHGGLREPEHGRPPTVGLKSLKDQMMTY